MGSQHQDRSNDARAHRMSLISCVQLPWRHHSCYYYASTPVHFLFFLPLAIARLLFFFHCTPLLTYTNTHTHNNNTTIQYHRETRCGACIYKTLSKSKSFEWTSLKALQLSSEWLICCQRTYNITIPYPLTI